MASPLLPFIFFLLSSLSSLASSFDFEVGDKAGWAVPSAKDIQLYNDWASKNRFQIGDSIVFKYDKDSVMSVAKEEYDDCRSSHPEFYANNGSTVFTFDRSGTFYFISGIARHCERGQKMIIKVMGHSEGPAGEPAGRNRTGDSGLLGSAAPDGSGGTGSARVLAVGHVLVLVILAGVSLF